ncbi:yeats family-domain-containing protein [Sporodiniella umbellata]|nr:yeats family-domain-containing protein [Sporodiniella umbellata]
MMNELSQEIKIICQNNIIKGKAIEGHPWRNWKIKVVAVDNFRERKGKLSYLLDRVEYVLHPTFENPVRAAYKEPYVLQEKGWGEFDMRVVLYFKNEWAEPENIYFDLHFREPTYTILHKVKFFQPSLPFIRLITHEFPPSDSEPVKKRKTSPSLASLQYKKSKTPPHEEGGVGVNTGSGYVADGTLGAYNKSVQDTPTIVDHVYGEKDLDKLDPIHCSNTSLDDPTRKAWGLPDTLDMSQLAKRLVSLTNEQMDEVETIIKNNMLQNNDEEFVVDLYSLGPELLTQLWEFTEKKSKSVALSPFSLVQANTAFIEE